jgi:hypothetical protein
VFIIVVRLLPFGVSPRNAPPRFTIETTASIPALPDTKIRAKIGTPAHRGWLRPPVGLEDGYVWLRCSCGAQIIHQATVFSCPSSGSNTSSRLRSREAVFNCDFGVAPRLRAALHAGPVITEENGETEPRLSRRDLRPARGVEERGAGVRGVGRVPPHLDRVAVRPGARGRAGAVEPDKLGGLRSEDSCSAQDVSSFLRRCR